MKISKRILSLMLTVSMLLTVAPMAVGATGEAVKPTYNTVIFNHDCTGFAVGSTSFPGSQGLSFTAGTAAGPVRNAFTNAATESIADGGHGTFIRYEKDATDASTGANTFYINYKGSGQITNTAINKYPAPFGNYANAGRFNALSYMEASFDVYVKAGKGAPITLEANDQMQTSMDGAYRQYQEIATFKQNGSNYQVSFNNGGARGADITIPADKWVTVSMQFDFPSDKYDVWFTYDGEDHLVVNDYRLRPPVSGTAASGIGGNYVLSGLRFNRNASKAGYKMYFDNFKYSINETTAVIGTMNFEEHDAGYVIKSSANNSKYSLYANVSNPTDVTTAEIVEENGRKFAKLTSAANEGGAKIQSFGLRTADMTGFKTKYGAYPTNVKLSFDIKKAGKTSAVYAFLGKSEPFTTGGNGGEFMMWNTDGTRQYGRSGGSAFKFTTSNTIDKDKWLNVEIDMNLATLDAKVYEDGAYAGTFKLKDYMTSLEYLTFGTNGVANVLCVDNVKFSAIAPYADDTILHTYIGDKLDANGQIIGDEYKVGYVINNSDGEVIKSCKFIKAKFNANGTLNSIAIIKNEAVEAGEVAVGSDSISIEADGSYYAYFVWNDLNDLVPVFNSVNTKTLKVNR